MIDDWEISKMIDDDGHENDCWNSGGQALSSERYEFIFDTQYLCVLSRKITQTTIGYWCEYGGGEGTKEIEIGVDRSYTKSTLDNVGDITATIKRLKEEGASEKNLG